MNNWITNQMKNKLEIKRIIVIIIAFLIIITSIGYVIICKNFIILNDLRDANPDQIGGYIEIDDKKVLKFNKPSDLIGSSPSSYIREDSEVITLAPGSHTLKIFFNNGSHFGTFNFFQDYNKQIRIIIYDNMEVSFKESHFYPYPATNFSHIIGFSDIEFILFFLGLTSMIIFCLLYWHITGIKIRKEQGNDEPNSKNKGG